MHIHSASHAVSLAARQLYLASLADTDSKTRATCLRIATDYLIDAAQQLGFDMTRSADRRAK